MFISIYDSSETDKTLILLLGTTTLREKFLKPSQFFTEQYDTSESQAFQTLSIKYDGSERDYFQHNNKTHSIFDKSTTILRGILFSYLCVTTALREKFQNIITVLPLCTTNLRRIVQKHSHASSKEYNAHERV